MLAWSLQNIHSHGINQKKLIKTRNIATILFQQIFIKKGLRKLDMLILFESLELFINYVAFRGRNFRRIKKKLIQTD